MTGWGEKTAEDFTIPATGRKRQRAFAADDVISIEGRSVPRDPIPKKAPHARASDATPVTGAGPAEPHESEGLPMAPMAVCFAAGMVAAIALMWATGQFADPPPPPPSSFWWDFKEGPPL